MAFEFEEQLALPMDVLTRKENEKRLIRALKLHLIEVYGTIQLIGDKNAKKSAALDLISDADRAITMFLREYFDPHGHDTI